MSSLLLFGFLAGCGLSLSDLTMTDPVPDLDPPVSTEVQGVVVQTPSNWTTTQESESVDNYTVVVLTAESSGSGLMMVQTYQPPLALDPTSFLSELQNGMQGSLEEGTFGSVATVAAGTQRDVTRTLFGSASPGRAAGFDFALMGVEVPTTVEVFTAQTDDVSVVIILQAADEDRGVVSPAFDHLVSTMAVARAMPTAPAR